MIKAIFSDLDGTLLNENNSLSEATINAVKKLKEKNINAVVIGKITAGNDRIVWNEEEKRFLEPPKSDELYKVREKRNEGKNINNYWEKQ